MKIVAVFSLCQAHSLFVWAFFGPLFLTCLAEPLTNEQLRSAVSDCLSDGTSPIADCSRMATWDTSAITDMNSLFKGARSFNANISGWDTSSVRNMASIFEDASAFNQPISSWNTGQVETMFRMFKGASSFNQPLSLWNMQRVTSTEEMFYHEDKLKPLVSSFNGDVSGWDTSAVRNMNRMFNGAVVFNQDLSTWDTKRVESMLSMFTNAEAFNGDISSWSTTSVTSMGVMFENAKAFNQDISSWDTSQVKSFRSMFSGALSFNQPIGSWNTSQVEEMQLMFRDAKRFNQDLSSWDTRKVTKMTSMFAFALTFNGDITSWDLLSATDLSQMLWAAEAFNQDISRWDVGRATEMGGMFGDAKSFNQNISPWDTSKVTDMTAMFYNAVSFNQDISNWQVDSVENMQGMFSSARKFNVDLCPWNASHPRNMDSMFDGCPKLSLCDVDECQGASFETKCAVCPPGAGVPTCSNTDGSFQCSCVPLQESCSASEVTLKFASSHQVSCTTFGSGCTPMSEYTCSSEGAEASVPGVHCTMEFVGLQRLCEYGGLGTTVVPGSLMKFMESSEYELDTAERTLLVKSLSLDKHKLSDTDPVRLKVEVERADNSMRWLCGGEPNERFFDLGSGWFGTALPYLYVLLSMGLTFAGEAVVDVWAAWENREWVKITVIVLDMAAAVVSEGFLVGETQEVKISEGLRIRSCTVSGHYDGMEFSFSEDCGDLQRVQRMGLNVAPLCRESVVLTHTAFFVALADTVFSVLVLLYYTEQLQDELRGTASYVYRALGYSTAEEQRPDGTDQHSAGNDDSAPMTTQEPDEESENSDLGGADAVVQDGAALSGRQTGDARSSSDDVVFSV